MVTPMIKKIILSMLAAVAAIAVVELGVRISESQHAGVANLATVEDLAKELPASTISGREINNQMLVHNEALFSKYPNPEEVTMAFEGTSRSKVLRPHWFGMDHAINASGNSYNEISYGLILQAEMLRRRFPNLKTIYVESSLLLRRPNRFIVEEDHFKYLPLLESILPLRDKLPEGDRFRKQVAEAKAKHGGDFWSLHLLKYRESMRFSELIDIPGKAKKEIPVTDDPLFPTLMANGERKSPPRDDSYKEGEHPEVTSDHVKVQRLRGMHEWKPWDGLFELFALWGREHNIEIIFFQPPVRSDLYKFKLQNELEAHVADLERVANKYHVAFIDMNRPELHYMDDWKLFIDEDHMDTCHGVALLQAGLEEGTKRFHEKGSPVIRIPRAEIEQIYADKIKHLCQ